MKNLKMILPMVAFVMAIAAAFAGNTSSALESVTHYKPTTECSTCSGGSTGCQTTSTSTKCTCTVSSQVKDGFNSSCQALYVPMP